jgi:hypothetical protein
MPANQRAPERQEGLVDVGALVVADAQAPELVQPGERPFHHPPPPPHAAAVSRSAHSEEWKNVTSSQPPSDPLGIVRTIAEYAVGTTPWSPSFALQRRDCIDKRQGLLRIVPVGSGQADGEWRAAPVADQMALAPALGPIGRIRPGLASPNTARMEQLSTTARDQSIWL